MPGAPAPSYIRERRDSFPTDRLRLGAHRHRARHGRLHPDGGGEAADIDAERVSLPNHVADAVSQRLANSDAGTDPDALR
jgi:hypothetical protein